MICRFLSVCVLLFAAAGLSAKDDSLVFALAATPEHPRNSEGSFATLRSGKIIYLYSQFSGGDSDFDPSRIAQIESTDEGRTWSAPRVLFTPAPGAMEMSVSLLRLASGKLACFTAVKVANGADCRPYLRISEDDGATWSAPRSIIDAPGYFVLNNDRVIQTSGGRLIMPLAWHRGMKAGAKEIDAIDLRAIDLWYYSDDEGATWKESDTWWALPAVTQTGLQEPGVVELADGTLLSWARTDQGCQYEFRSKDHGVTWSAPQPMAIRSPAAPASIMRLPHSDQLLASYIDYSGQYPFELTPRTYRGRSPLVAAVSSDGGVTWRNRKLLEGDQRFDYCYVAIHFTKDAVLFAYLGFGKENAAAAATGTMVIRRVSLANFTEPEDALTLRARAVLHEVMDSEESWIKIHAAEALVAGGDAAGVRARMLALRAKADTLPYRVGVWRVLANTSATLPERAACVAEVEKIFLNPAAPDRSQALETLCKLRHPVTGAALAEVRKLAGGPPSSLRGLALWALLFVDEPGARGALAEMLQAPDEVQRLVGAYALRMFREQDAGMLGRLAQAAKQESPQSRAYPYLVSAAFSLKADPAHRPAWRAELEKIMATASSADEARFEACQGLLPQATPADLPALAGLLDHPGKDTRVGAALVILSVAARR